MPACENCRLDRWVKADNTRVCVPKNAFRSDVVSPTPVEVCDNKEVFEPLTPEDKADAAYRPLRKS